MSNIDKTKTIENQNGKTFTGEVLSMNMEKTIVVDIERSKSHPLYGKSFKVNHKIKARNDLNDISVGDIVTITETKPYSKNVAFKVIKKIER
jgi:small subunit ribosomal protein S17